jgi:phosphoribosylformylglycinamidine synthase
VSFYNEDPDRAVFPSPVIGMIGLIEDIDHITTQWFDTERDVIFLLGENKEELGASEYLHTIYHQTKGDVPELDLEAESELQSALLAAITSGLVVSAHDCADGGLGVALAECCMSNREKQLGAQINLGDNLRLDCLLFGETQSRVVISCRADAAAQIEKHFRDADIPCRKIGVVGGKTLKINGAVDLPVAKLSDAWHNALTRIMESSTGR